MNRYSLVSWAKNHPVECLMYLSPEAGLCDVECLSPDVKLLTTGFCLESDDGSTLFVISPCAPGLLHQCGMGLLLV